MASGIVGVTYQGRVQMGSNATRLAQWGQAAFAGAALTCFIPISMHTVERILFEPITQPGLATRSMPPIMPGTVSASYAQNIIAPAAGTISAVTLVETAVITANDTNYWSFGLLNKTQTLTPVAIATAANTTKATGGMSLAAYTAFNLTLGVAAQLAVAAADVLELSITKTSSPSNLTELYAVISYSSVAAGGTDEQLYWADTQSSTPPLVVPSTGGITIARTSLNPTNNLRFSYDVWGN